MADQIPEYRATAVTQRDGSSLANQNCRMAAIATAIDFHTLGDTRSSGKAMRAAQDDQTGGTDSGDARQAWQDGYGESLAVGDGGVWADVLEALEAGRMVCLDVWHASVSGAGICHSGSGAYGHTIAVAPDLAGDSWLVSDPWCSPGKWGRVTAAELRQGAEEWGGRVYREATGGHAPPSSSPLPELLALAGRRLMSRSYPGHERTIPERDDTGGGVVLFTYSRAQAMETDDMGPTFSPKASVGVATVHTAGNLILTSSGEFQPIPLGYVRNVAQIVTKTDEPYAGQTAYLVSAGDGESALLMAFLATYVPHPTDGDPGSIDERDAEWISALTHGEPWPATP
jgi:hypothetical protein